MLHMFMPGDLVNYSGSNSKLNSEIGNKVGEVKCRVEGEPDGVVVDFGDDAYIVNASSLRRLPKEKGDIEITRNRKQSYETEE